MNECSNCDGSGWVCENHADRPWGGMAAPGEGCGCGAGMPCGVCNLQMASARYSEPWRQLADRAISSVESAVRETNWGQPTFGPNADEELRAEYDALRAAQVGTHPQGGDAKQAPGESLSDAVAESDAP